jgi:class 3 adenylate cyclase/tetratricopeptide (TPR) repeat protein
MGFSLFLRPERDSATHKAPPARPPSTVKPPAPRAKLGGSDTIPPSRTLPGMRACVACGAENEEGARFCSRCGTALATQADAPTEELRKVVTTLFADVAGSTAVGERLDPESLRRVMSRHFDEIKRIVEEHGGVVEKFIGDAVMAVFGVPRVHEDDALRAVRAAVAVRDRLAELDGELREGLGVSIGWRIGVNTGEVVAGDAGAGQRFVTGDAVNLAKRLEEAAGTGEVVIGGTTHRLVRDAVSAEPLDALMVKGKAEPIRAYRLLAVASGVAGSARRADAPMVGRERQRQTLTDAFGQATADRVCHLFTILGAAGVGKSRLVNEFLTGLDPGVRLLRGRCLSYGHGITFWPIREMVHEAAGITDDDTPATARDRIAAMLAGASADEAERIVERVAETVGLIEAAPNPEETVWAVRRLFEALARERPLVLVFDDVHWAEPGLLDLIENVADWSRDAPILLLCIGRRELLEMRPAWGGGKLAATTVQLEALNAAESDELVVNLLGQAQLEADVRQRIAEAADGNPLFVEELLAMLIDDGSLVRSNGSWTAARDLRRIAVPPTIQALLAARLDLLARPERSVMESGAVEGKVFHASAVAALVPDAVRAEVPAHLLSLMRKELLRPDRPAFSGDEAYRFRHLLIRDAAYEAMPKQARAEMHRRFADWLEVAAGERRTEYEEILGHHLEQAYRYLSELALPDADAATLARRAAEYLGAAGIRASDRGDFHAARRLLESAVNLLHHGSLRAPLLERLGVVLHAQAEVRAAREALDSAIQEYGDLKDRVGAARAEVALLDVRSSLESLEADEVVARGEELVVLLGEAGDVEGWAAATLLVGENLFFLGRATEAITRLREGLQRAPVGSRVRGEMIHWLTACMFWGPTPVDEAVPAMERLIADNPGHPWVEAGTRRAVGGLKAMRGAFGEARADIARADRLAEETGLKQIAHSSGAMFLAPVELLAEDPQTALEAARRSYEAMAATGDLAFSSTAAGHVAKALGELNRWDEAERYALIATDTSAATDAESQALGREVQGLVLAHRGEFETAERLAREALAIREQGEYVDGHGDSLSTLAEVLRLAGRPAEAVESFNAALALYRQKGNLVRAARTERQIAELTAD